VIDAFGAASTSAYSEEAPPIEGMLAFLRAETASDLHLTVGLPPIARIEGRLVPVPGTPVLTPGMVASLVNGMMTEPKRRDFESDLEVDFSFAYANEGRFRVNVFHERGNPAAALRRIPDEPLLLQELGLPSGVAMLATLKRGLVLVTGPTGSGKTTTQAAIIDKINRERQEHIITIEDPIEFVHGHKQSIVQQREVGNDTAGFARALKSALREDPDVLLIGEMRDLETMAAAITAAETGHLVLATLHTTSAVQSIDRMIDVFPPHQQAQIRLQLSASLQAILAQRLVPLVDGTRACVCEFLVANDAVRNLIREGKTHLVPASMQSGVADGMVMFDPYLERLVRTGRLAFDIAITFASDPKGFKTRFFPNER